MRRPVEILTENLLDHPSVRGWSQLNPQSVAPNSIQILKRKQKSAVYRLLGVGPNGSAVIAKRCQTATARIERAIYESFLSRMPLPALACHGLVPEPEGEFCWLFLDDAGGQEYSPHEPAHRALAGRWLGTVHQTAVGDDLQALLPDRGPGHYLQRLRSTRAALLERVGNPALAPAEAGLLRTLAEQCDIAEAHWNELERFCEGRPRALVHGDFVIKNLRLHPAEPSPGLMVFDWEMSGWGLPASDLAQFVGNVATPDLEVYSSVLRRDSPRPNLEDIRRLADYGALLRVVDKIFWETICMVSDAYEFLATPLLLLKGYEPQLNAALRALDWTGHD